MLRLREVWAGYRSMPILHGIDLDLAAGEVVAVLGRNGVGKSTLLRAITGLIPVTGGSIELLGRDLARVPVHQRAKLGLGYVPQGRDIFPRLTAYENLLVSAHASGVDARTRIGEVLEQFPGLERLFDRNGGSLSGGEQQLLALARALIGRPQVLLLDEPSEGLQPSLLDVVAERITEIKESGIAVLLVEQNLDFAAELAERAYIIDGGRVRRELAPSALLEDPLLQHEFIGG